MDYSRITCFAADMRRSILDISHTCNLSVHLGGGLSIVDIVATLYSDVLRYDKSNPEWIDRDRFILSKGHGVLGLYSALLVAGIISKEVYQSFLTNESDLIAHPVMNLSLGIESSNGSLGQGLSMGIGLALAAKLKNMKHKIYVLMGDGECNEGSVWEAAMLAAHLKLDNLIAIVDNNGFQSDGKSSTIMGNENFHEKWNSFAWEVKSVDGHDVRDLHGAFRHISTTGKPRVVIANTIKGKGVSFMENNNDWHHTRLTKSQHELALRELEANQC